MTPYHSRPHPPTLSNRSDHVRLGRMVESEASDIPLPIDLPAVDDDPVSPYRRKFVDIVTAGLVIVNCAAAVIVVLALWVLK